LPGSLGLLGACITRPQSGTEADQLAALSRIVGGHYNDRALAQGVSLPDWEALFTYLTERAEGAAFMLVVDEFPYLAEAAPRAG
jgi:AAA+ ATPase superfamily predicted ATPase